MNTEQTWLHVMHLIETAVNTDELVACIWDVLYLDNDEVNPDKPAGSDELYDIYHLFTEAGLTPPFDAD